jgi:hypothetical protein
MPVMSTSDLNTYQSLWHLVPHQHVGACSHALDDAHRHQLDCVMICCLGTLVMYSVARRHLQHEGHICCGPWA